MPCAVDFCGCDFAIFATLLIHTNGRNYFGHFVKSRKKIIPRTILLFSGDFPLKKAFSFVSLPQ